MPLFQIIKKDKMSGKCCFTGNLHTGEPLGKFEEVFGLKTYVTGSPSNEKVLVILTDVFGNELNNTKLIADQLAGEDFKVYVPDILFGDNVKSLDGSVDFHEWAHNHRPEITRPIVDQFMKSLQATFSPKFVGVVGHCFGAKYALHQIDVKQSTANAIAVAHPSLCEQEEFRAIGKHPILISAAQTDSIFTVESRHETEKTLNDIGAVYQIDLFSQVTHGFAVRGDVSDPCVLYAKEKVTLDQIHWFKHFSKDA